MSQENLDKLAIELRDMVQRKIRVDLSPTHLDPHFLSLFLIYWLASQPVSVRTGKPTVLDLVQAGLRSKFKADDSLIRQKIVTYCEVKGITLKELLEAVRQAIGFEISAITETDIKSSEKGFFDLGQK